MKYYIEEVDPAEWRNVATSKARVDIFNILDSLGYEKITVGCKELSGDYSGVKRKAKELAYIMNNTKVWKQATAHLKAGDVLVVQYPPHFWLRLRSILVGLRKRGVRLVAVVHDMDSIRWNNRNKVFKNYFSIEDRFALPFFNKIIIHNSYMKDLMKAIGYKPNKLVSLGVFDYLWEKDDNAIPAEERIHKDAPVVIAGNLSPGKATYLYNFDHNVGTYFNLYGIYIEEDKIKNLDYTYKGVGDADKLPEILEGSYGLVWDGTDIDMCRGEYGEYLKVNNPHKFSLYLASCLPIIIWKQAALADVVEKYNLGFTINSLDDIAVKRKNITEAQYNQMVENIKRFSKKVSSGYFMKRAMDIVEGKRRIR